jgi:hypothetical protein
MLPEALPAGTPLQLQLRSALTGSGHAVRVAVDGQPLGILSWSDPPTGA